MITIPSDLALVDTCVCKNSRLLVLMKSRTTGNAEIVCIETKNLEFISAEQAAEFRHPISEASQLVPMSWTDGCVQQELVKTWRAYSVHIEAIEKRQRTHRHPGAVAPLAASHTGLAVVLSDQRLMIYNLEVDEDI